MEYPCGCSDFIINDYFYGHVEKETSDFYSLNDISDLDGEQEFYTDQLWLRVADRFGSIHYIVISNCPFCGAKLQ